MLQSADPEKPGYMESSRAYASITPGRENSIAFKGVLEMGRDRKRRVQVGVEGREYWKT